MKQYVRPEVLVTYIVEELVEEAAVCTSYGPLQTPPQDDGPFGT